LSCFNAKIAHTYLEIYINNEEIPEEDYGEKSI